MPETVYLNGRFVPYDQALIPVEDRANVFADGVYEVVRYYGGRPLALDLHMERLANSAKAIRMPEIDVAELAARGSELIRVNEIDDGTLYLQVSRGVAPRNHAFPVGAPPTVFMIARQVARPDLERRTSGVVCVTTPDTRWARCDIKSIALLPNILAKQEARDRGAFEALFVRDGVITEGSTSNVFGVRDGLLLTHPEGPRILPGITRRVVLALAEAEGIPVSSELLRAGDLGGLQELFISSTTAEITPVRRVDDMQVGDGAAGPLTRRLLARYDALVQDVRSGRTTAL